MRAAFFVGARRSGGGIVPQVRHCSDETAVLASLGGGVTMIVRSGPLSDLRGGAPALPSLHLRCPSPFSFGSFSHGGLTFCYTVGYAVFFSSEG